MNRIVIFLTFFCLSFSSLYSFAEDNFFPAPILSLSDGITPHALVVEKATNTLSIYENQDNKPRLLKSFKIGTGKLSGDKKTQGDSKTPEGAYRFLEFYSKQELIKRYGKEAPIYGIGAFTISYPNIFDLLQKKTGGGIWLHSTNDNSRINQGQTSRGCVVVTDEQLKEISQYVSLRNTPILIVQELNFLETKTWEKNRNKLLQTVEGWRKAWEQENLDDYISYYDHELFKSGSRGKIKTYKTYK
ncbi:MAG: L,D-transpeptidase family protein, partial [Bacteriovoracaceae bacterium]|nr:L,D-transpeptidase family protein [Bacteriovoracaceae bacterium]